MLNLAAQGCIHGAIKMALGTIFTAKMVCSACFISEGSY